MALETEHKQEEHHKNEAISDEGAWKDYYKMRQVKFVYVLNVA